MISFRLFHACLALFVTAVSAPAQFTLDLLPVAPGTGELRFTLEFGYYYRLESSGDLTGGFAEASGWMLGNGVEAIWPVQYPSNPTPGGGAATTATGDTFSLYPFDNGKTLVTWNDLAEMRYSALIAQDYSALPPLVTVSGSETVPYLTLLVGGIAWDSAYELLSASLLPVEQQTVLARLTTRHAEVLAAATGGTGGPGIAIDSENHFFRLRRMETDADGDGLDWAIETFQLHTDPDNADTDGDGISDGDEIALGLQPGNDDSDGDTVKDGNDAYPNDDKRSEDIPVKFYGVIDLGSYLSSPLGNPLGPIRMAIDDDNQVAFGTVTATEMRAVVWKNGGVLSDAVTPKTNLIALPFPGLYDWHEFHIVGIGANGLAAGNVAPWVGPSPYPYEPNHDWNGGWCPGNFTFSYLNGLLESPAIVDDVAYPTPNWPDPPPDWISLVGPSGSHFAQRTSEVSGGGGYVVTPVWAGAEFSSFTASMGLSSFWGMAASQHDYLLWRKSSVGVAQTLLYDPIAYTHEAIPAPTNCYGINDQKLVVGSQMEWVQDSTPAGGHLVGYENPAQDFPDPLPGNPNHTRKGRGELGFLWSPTEGLKTFHDLLPGKFWKQLRHAVPNLITNVDPVTNEPTITFSAEVVKGDGSGEWVSAVFQWEKTAENETKVNEVQTPMGETPTLLAVNSSRDYIGRGKPVRACH